MIPVPAIGELQALGVGEAQAMHVVDEHQQTGDLHGLVDAEFFGRFHGVGEVTTGVGETENLRFGRLRL